jgi:hypothetical protein
MALAACLHGFTEMHGNTVPLADSMLVLESAS